MIVVTNGSVSRTVKPADYEGRTVSLSFNCDPGDDVEAGVRAVLAVAEHLARGEVPAQVAVEQRHQAFLDELKRVVKEKAPVVAEKPDPSANAPTAEAQPSVGEGTIASGPVASSAMISDADLQTACNQARSEGHVDPDTGILPTIKKYAVGGGRAAAIPVEQRQAFLDELKSLYKKPVTPAAGSDPGY